MARPERNNVDYFPFDCKEGKKMYYIEETYGNDGFATFVKLLRELANADHHFLNLQEQTTTMYLAAKCKINTELLERIIVDLVNLEKFDRDLWESSRVIWCQDFVDSIADAYRKRTNEIITRPELIEKLSASKVYKGKKSEKTPAKTEKKAPEIPTEAEFLAYCRAEIPEQFEALEFSIRAKYEQWKANGWKDGHGKPIKIWKTKILNTLPHLKPMYHGPNTGTTSATLRDQRDSDASTSRIVGKLQENLDADNHDGPE